MLIKNNINFPSMRASKFLLFYFLIVMFSCKKDNNPAPNPILSNFSASSSVIGSNGQLPKLYTCDSTGLSLPFAWTGAPSGTVSYAIIMNSANNTSMANMVLYNISSSVTSIAAGATTTGVFGVNSYNGLQGYSAPCQQNQNSETYNVTVYALSEQPVISVPPNQVSASTLKQAISSITIDTAMFSFSYTREENPSSFGFIATCPAVGTDSILPKLYTCDSLSYSPPVSWANSPAGTNSYAVVMNTIILPTQSNPNTDMHVYMILYDIPSNLSSIPGNVSGIGLFGHNTLNPTLSYSPPCSQGPGFKYYYITAYALSRQPNLPVQNNVTYPVFQDAIRSIVLDSSKITVKYSR